MPQIAPAHRLMPSKYKDFQDPALKSALQSILRETLESYPNYHKGLVCPAISLKVRRYIDSLGRNKSLDYTIKETDDNTITLTVFGEYGTFGICQNIAK